MAMGIPKRWRQVEVGEVIESIAAGVSVNAEDVPVASEAEIGVLKTSCVTTGIFRAVENKKVVPEEVSRVATPVCAGTIIVSRMNTPALVGASAYVPTSHGNLYLPDRLWQVHVGAGTSAKWLSHALATPSIRRKLQSVASGTSGSMKNLSQEAFRSLAVRLPPEDEQRRIAAVARTMDSFLSIHNNLLRCKVRVLDDLRNRMLGGPARATRVQLGKVTRECIARNRGKWNQDSVMAVTKEFGLCPMRTGTIASNISRYKIVPSDAFAYNPMRLNIGSIARSGFSHDVLVSPDYVVFECDEKRLLPAYLDHLRHTRQWSSFFTRAGAGGVRVRIYYDDLSQFKVGLPPVNEQKKIVRLLDTAQREVELLQRQGGALERQKRGLMQKLLTGQWRLTSDRLRDLTGDLSDRETAHA